MARSLARKGAALLSAVLLGLLGRASSASAQDFSVPDAPHRIEFGLFRQDHERTFRNSDGDEEDGKFDRLAAYVRVRIAPGVAIEGNGGAWHIGTASQFPSRDYVQYSVGTGVTATPVRVAGVQLGATVHYWRLANVDQSPTRYDKLQHQWSVAFGGGHTLSLGKQSLTIWAGPVYVVDWLDQFPPTSLATHARSVDNLGGVVTGSIILGKTIRFSSRLTFLGAMQTQFGGAILL